MKPDDHARQQEREESQDAQQQFIVEIGSVEDLTGHDSHGSRNDGSGTSNHYKDPGRGAGE